MKVKLREVLQREFGARNRPVTTIAEETGVPSSTLHSWIHGQNPSAKNLHHLKTLSDYLGISLSMLLFNEKEQETKAKILFSGEFMDQDVRYRITIEKIKE